MLVSSYYKKKACERLYLIERELYDTNRRPAILTSIIESIATMLLEKKEAKEMQEMIRSKISEYQISWFSFPLSYETKEQQFHRVQNADYKLFQRYLKWLLNKCQKERILEVNCTCEVPVIKELVPDERLSTKVHMITQDSAGQYHAYIVSFSEPMKSQNGKSLNTNLNTDLHVMVAKEYLESKYPKISIRSVHVKNSTDKDTVIGELFIQNETLKSNVLSCSNLASYYKEGAFMQQSYHQLMEEACMASEMVKTSCQGCFREAICKAPKIEFIGSRIETEEESISKTMDFTKEQSAVIKHTNGPLVVCAGPGSGKSQTLIARIQNLIDNGIAPEFMLAITFTKEAANVLKERCLAFSEMGRTPYIATLNSLGFDILRSNKEVLGREFKLLTMIDNLIIIQSLVNGFPKIEGFSYALIYGKNGLLNVMARRLKEYALLSTEEFYMRHPEIGRGFTEFATMYQAIIKERDFITYDEQISIAVAFLKEYPEVLEQYQKVFQYIMVDEYQDIDELQAEFIYLLAGEKQNLVVVGDDDQSIYKFRGGKNKFLLEFSNVFQCQTIILQDNFRSVRPIVESCEKMIRQNQVRIEKQIRANRESANCPTLVPCNSISTVQAVIQDALAKGYRYQDCAILSFKNSDLETLHRDLTMPNVLAKVYIRKEALFRVLYICMSVYFKTDANFRELLLELMQILNIREQMPVLDETFLLSAYEGQHEALLLMKKACIVFESSTNFKEVIYRMAMEIGLHGSIAEESMINLIEDHHLESAEDVYRHMQYMVLFEDDSRMKFEQPDAVLLITSHDSKGNEFPVVIIYDGGSYVGSKDLEESRRLFYVAATRAKDLLYVLTEKESEATFMDGIGVVDTSLVGRSMVV